jgi:hypothetical protein
LEYKHQLHHEAGTWSSPKHALKLLSLVFPSVGFDIFQNDSAYVIEGKENGKAYWHSAKLDQCSH